MPRFHVVAVLVVFGCVIATGVCVAECSFASIRATENKQPIFLRDATKTGYEFLLPQNGSVRLRGGEEILISCPNPRNFLIQNKQNLTRASCSNGKVKIANRLHDFTALQCNKSIRGDIKATNEKCGHDEGRLTNIGYYIGREFVTLIKVCYDGNKGNTLYSAHTIHGDSIKNASHSKLRPSFNTAGLGAKVSASVAYKQAFQKSTFNKLLGSSALADSYINRKSYLSRGHLAPDADFFYAAWQLTTYFYINTCPQWQTINGGNWHKIESAVRKSAGKLGDKLHVFTGCHGVLTLPDAAGSARRIFLVSGDVLPVPKYIWKIVSHPRRNRAVVIAILNDPFVQNRTDLLCPNICKETGWDHKQWHINEKGLVHCCDYNKFAKIVPTIPYLNITSVFKNLN